MQFYVHRSPRSFASHCTPTSWLLSFHPGCSHVPLLLLLLLHLSCIQASAWMCWHAKVALYYAARISGLCTVHLCLRMPRWLCSFVMHLVHTRMSTGCSHRCAGSTTAEGACESVRLACQQLVQNTLAPMMQEVAAAQKQDTAEAKWKAVLQQASSPITFPNRQLSAYAIFDGSRRDKPPG